MTFAYLLALALASLVPVYAAPPPPGPVINLGYASLLGNATTPTGSPDGPVHFFGSVPFAQPPVGSLRFRAPQRLDEKPRKNPPVLDTRNFGPECIQQPATAGVGSEGEEFMSRGRIIFLLILSQTVFFLIYGNLVRQQKELNSQ